MTTVGILSDNHGDWPLHIVESLAGVDAIIHAGDIGPYKLLLGMEAIAPTTAVLGNTDGDMPINESAVVMLDGKKFFVQHIVDPHRLQKPRRLKRRKGIGDDVAGLAMGGITEIEQMVAGAVESLVNRQTGRHPGLDNSIPGNPRPHVGDVYQIRRAKLAIDSTLLRHAALSELCTCDRIIRSS